MLVKLISSTLTLFRGYSRKTLNFDIRSVKITSRLPKLWVNSPGNTLKYYFENTYSTSFELLIEVSTFYIHYFSHIRK